MPLQNKSNDYMIDRVKQRFFNYTGIVNTPVQDFAVTENQRGPITDRTRERLVSADKYLIHVRRRLMDAARALQQGIEPDEPHNASAFGLRLPRRIELPMDVPFEEAVAYAAGPVDSAGATAPIAQAQASRSPTDIVALQRRDLLRLAGGVALRRQRAARRVRGAARRGPSAGATAAGATRRTRECGHARSCHGGAAADQRCHQSRRASSVYPTYIPNPNLPYAGLPRSRSALRGRRSTPSPGTRSSRGPSAPPSNGGTIDVSGQPVQHPSPRRRAIRIRPGRLSKPSSVLSFASMRPVPTTTPRVSRPSWRATTCRTSCISIAAIARRPTCPEFFKAKCADLTPYLGGDAVKDYPNLAAIPTYAWKNSISAIDGKLYLIPVQRQIPAGVANNIGYFFRNTDIWNKTLGENTNPRTAADFKSMLQQLNRPSQNQWAVENVATYWYGLPAYMALFGAPYNWKLDAAAR